MLPVIFITGHGDVPMAVQAMKEGAFDFIQKPFREQDLVDRINHALQQDAENRKTVLEQADLRKRLDSLTQRERQVLDLVVDGRANKVIAIDCDSDPNLGANIGLGEEGAARLRPFLDQTGPVRRVPDGLSPGGLRDLFGAQAIAKLTDPALLSHGGPGPPALDDAEDFLFPVRSVLHLHLQHHGP